MAVGTRLGIRQTIILEYFIDTCYILGNTNARKLLENFNGLPTHMLL